MCVYLFVYVLACLKSTCIQTSVCDVYLQLWLSPLKTMQFCRHHACTSFPGNRNRVYVQSGSPGQHGASLISLIVLWLSEMLFLPDENRHR